MNLHRSLASVNLHRPPADAHVRPPASPFPTPREPPPPRLPHPWVEIDPPPKSNPQTPGHCSAPPCRRAVERRRRSGSGGSCRSSRRSAPPCRPTASCPWPTGSGTSGSASHSRSRHYSPAPPGGVTPPPARFAGINRGRVYRSCTGCVGVFSFQFLGKFLGLHRVFYGSLMGFLMVDARLLGGGGNGDR
jgi:hypothetical protein